MKKNSSIKKSGIFMLVSILIILSSTVNAQVFTLFNDTFTELNLKFEENSVHSFFVSLPNSNIITAKMSISGEPSVTQTTQNADVIIVTDVSGSMSGTRLTNAKAADTLFVNTVDTNYVHVGLVKYSTCPIYSADVLGLTDDKSVLNQTISSYVAGGWTNIARGLEFAIMELMSPRAQETDRKFILLMTDGEANYYFDPGINGCLSSTSLARQRVLDMAQVAAENGIIIYGIAFGDDTGSSMELLQNASSITGGETYHVPTGAQLQQLYEQIAQTISTAVYPEPIINNELPNGTIMGWSSNQGLNQNATWNGSDCGIPTATCIDFKQVIQNAVDSCYTESCPIIFDLESFELGRVKLFDLYIEVVPKANITCVDFENPPTYILRNGEYLKFPVSDIFQYGGDPGEPIDIIIQQYGNVDFLNNALPEFINATPNNLEGTQVSFIRILTDKNILSSSCPVRFSTESSILGSIDCSPITPHYVFTNNNVKRIPLNEIFVQTGSPGTPEEISEKIENGVSITSNLPLHQSITVEKTDLTGTKVSEIRVKTELGVYSEICPIMFTYVNSMCGKPECEQLINSGDIASLKTSGCLDSTINVYNPYILKVMYEIYPVLRNIDFVTNYFTVPSQLQPSTNEFIIFPNQGTKNVVFEINGITVADGLEGVSVAKIIIPDSQEEIIFCSLLARKNFNLNEPVGDANSDLLVTGSRAVAGYYSMANRFLPIGPFIFTAKVWLR